MSSKVVVVNRTWKKRPDKMQQKNYKPVLASLTFFLMCALISWQCYFPTLTTWQYFDSIMYTQYQRWNGIHIGEIVDAVFIHTTRKSWKVCLRARVCMCACQRFPN